MSDPFLDLTHSLAVERRLPAPHPPKDDGLDDLRAVIHILAMAMTDGKSVS